jgi:hypothetical protein
MRTTRRRHDDQADGMRFCTRQGQEGVDGSSLHALGIVLQPRRHKVRDARAYVERCGEQSFPGRRQERTLAEQHPQGRPHKCFKAKIDRS